MTSEISVGERVKRAISVLNENRGSSRYTSPTTKDGHYPGWYKWDCDFAALSRARLGDSEGASQELFVELEQMNPQTGFIPNMVTFNRTRIWDLEPYTFSTPNKSSYTQPPVMAWAARETYDSFLRAGQGDEGLNFLNSIYTGVAAHFKYFMNFREMSQNNPLIFNIHPHETGRDYDPVLDHIFGGLRLPVRWRSDRKGLDFRIDKTVRMINTVTGYIDRLRLGWLLKMNHWDENAGRRLDGTQDVMMNAIYIHGLRNLSEIAGIIGKLEDASSFSQKADEVTRAMIRKMWDPKVGINGSFRALNREGRRIKSISVSNLFPIILKGIDRNEVSAILDLMESSQWFGTDYPVPSVPVNDSRFDPKYEEPRLWRGTTWPPTNLYLVDQGLLPKALEYEFSDPKLSQRLYRSALRICRASAVMVERGYSESKNSLTGGLVRTKTSQNFSWGVTLELLAIQTNMIENKLI